MSKRARCNNCDRALVACFCHTIKPLTNQLSVIILQHPSEVKHAKGTAKIAQLSLSDCDIMVGEDFSDNPLFEQTITGKKSLLLYPNESAMSPEQLIDKISQDESANLSDYQLIVLDGSWKKAYKIFCLNPILATLPCIGISSDNDSNYRIRKSSRSDSLSTIEAIHSLLSTVERKEGNAGYFDSLLVSFDAMVEFQLNAMPKDVQARY